MRPTQADEIAVLGAGVIGLSCAYEIAQAGRRVRVIAKDFPKDLTSTNFASPWAGANWCPFQDPKNNPNICRWEAETFPRLVASGLSMPLRETRRFAREEAGLHSHWYKDIVSNYKRLPASACPAGQIGVQFDTLSVNAPKYCQWLEEQCKALGVVFEHASVESLAELHQHGFKTVINATGLGGAKKIAADDKVQPIRGQTVLIKTSVKKCTMSDGGQGPPAYIIPRPGGEAICGGTYLIDDWTTEPDMETAKAILTRCLALEPGISADGTIEGIEVIRHNVGLRPGRIDGPRVEGEFGKLPEHFVIHAYGLGPAGYQASWGVATEVARILEAFRPKRPSKL